MSKNKDNTQKSFTAKQLIEAVENARLKKGEAIINITKREDNLVHLKWAGSSKDLLDITYTMLQNDMSIAAIICRATKDYIDTLKSCPQEWMRLTQKIASFDYSPAENVGSRKEEVS